LDHFASTEILRRYVSATDANRARETAIIKLSDKLAALHFVDHANPKSHEILENFERDIIRFRELLCTAASDYSTVDPTVSFTRFANQHDYYEELTKCFADLAKDDKAIRDHFSPIANELSPASLQARQSLLGLIGAGILGDVLLAIGLAIFFGKKTLARMNVLMDNIQRFSKGSTNLSSLHGSDELAKLGECFSEMAEQRTRAEELRATFLSMVSHDLRSPLSSCSITLTMLMERQAEGIPAKAMRSIRIVNSEMTRLVRMADSLLTVAQIEKQDIKLNFTTSPVRDLLGASMNAVSGMAEARTIEFELEGDLDGLISCDTDKVIQVLVNLLSNAVKFSPAKSTITLAVHRLKTDKYRFEVRDQGLGIPPEQIHRLFEKFSQLDQPAAIKRAGSGLGLYISKLLVQKHGGDIGCESSSTGGSLFWVELPAVVSNEQTEVYVTEPSRTSP
jgi:signal transduction histidine kinase